VAFEWCQRDGLVNRHGSLPSKAGRAFDCHLSGFAQKEPRIGAAVLSCGS
jgi:hypothetical protein